MHFKKRNMITILEGADMTGKSQIARELAKMLKLPCFKASTEKETFLSNQERFINDLKYADTRMVDFLKQTQHGCVFDRAYPSEWVYSQYFNRPTDWEALTYVDREFASLDAHIVICKRKSYDGIVDNLNPKLKGKELVKLASLYERFALWTNCKVYKLYVDDEDLNREVKEVMKWLNA